MKQKLRAEFPVPNNYTTTPLIPENTGIKSQAPQPVVSSNVAPPLPTTTTLVHAGGWGGPPVAQPTQPAYNQTAPINIPKKKGYENLPPAPMGSPTPGSPAAGDWGGPQNQQTTDPFSLALAENLQAVADKQSKRSTTSRDSWATRTSDDARKRDLSRNGGSQNHIPAPGRTTSNTSRGKGSSRGKKSDPSQSGMVAGPVQTYRPSGSNSRLSRRNDNNSDKGGSKRVGSGNGGQAAAAEPAAEGDFW